MTNLEIIEKELKERQALIVRIESKFKQQIKEHVYNICFEKLSTEIDEQIDNLVNNRLLWIDTYFSESFLNDCEEPENIEEIQQILIDMLDEGLTEEYEKRQALEIGEDEE